MILDRIHKENDIKKISKSELPRLAGEIREFLIEKVSENGGHLGSNLGVVELTIALHRQLTLPKDKIIFDVGHQAYIHKLLTGRREGFDTLRQFGGMSGFPKRHESDCDVFDTGHSSTSISAGLGLDLELALAGVVGAGKIDGLPRRRDQHLQNARLVVGLVKEAAVHGQGALPILRVHEGQKTPELRQKLLFVDSSHLR